MNHMRIGAHPDPAAILAGPLRLESFDESLRLQQPSQLLPFFRHNIRLSSKVRDAGDEGLWRRVAEHPGQGRIRAAETAVGQTLEDAFGRVLEDAAILGLRHTHRLDCFDPLEGIDAVVGQFLQEL